MARPAVVVPVAQVVSVVPAVALLQLPQTAALVAAGMAGARRALRELLAVTLRGRAGITPRARVAALPEILAWLELTVVVVVARLRPQAALPAVPVVRGLICLVARSAAAAVVAAAARHQPVDLVAAADFTAAAEEAAPTAPRL